jgi:c-di-GMP-binding flagellar brake protein YcgR
VESDYRLKERKLQAMHNNFQEEGIMDADIPKIRGSISIEKRKYIRIDVPGVDSFNVTLKFNGSKHTGCRLMNISIEGAIVAALRPIALAIGSLIEGATITFPDGEKIISPAIVRHISRGPDFWWHKYGIQFTELSKTQRNIINNFVLQNMTK